MKAWHLSAASEKGPRPVQPPSPSPTPTSLATQMVTTVSFSWGWVWMMSLYRLMGAHPDLERRAEWLPGLPRTPDSGLYWATNPRTVNKTGAKR